MIKKIRILIMIVLVVFVNTKINAQRHLLRTDDLNAGGILRISDVKASSFLIERNMPKNSYKPIKAFDGKFDTAWVEGVQGSGLNEWIVIHFQKWYSYSKLNKVYRLLIINGLAKNRDLYFANNRVKKLEIEFSEGQKRIIHFKDGVLTYQIFKFNHIPAKWIKLKILEVYKGTKYDDTCISEIQLEHDDSEYFKRKK